MDTATGRRDSFRRWLVVVVLAVLAHVVLLIGVKPSYLAFFRKSLDDVPASGSRPVSMPDAIVAVSVRVEGEEPLPVEIEPPPEDRRENRIEEELNPPESDEEPTGDFDLPGEAIAPLPSKPATRSVVIPPRPVEITWPETRNLNHCLGSFVDVRVQVDATGKIRVVEPVGTEQPRDCVDAAVRAASRIVFLPGRADGKPRTMWTEIRIEFRRQSR
jgi:hypothetical protein